MHEVTKVDFAPRAKAAYQEADGGEIDENLCADAGFVGSAPSMQAHGYIPHIRPRNVEADLIKKHPDFKPRRWVAEAFFSWLKRFRKVHVRYEKALLTYWGLVTLACALICLKRACVI